MYIRTHKSLNSSTLIQESPLEIKKLYVLAALQTEASKKKNDPVEVTRPATCVTKLMAFCG
jgi:hypothetical protein